MDDTGSRNILATSNKQYRLICVSSETGPHWLVSDDVPDDVLTLFVFYFSVVDLYTTATVGSVAVAVNLVTLM